MTTASRGLLLGRGGHDVHIFERLAPAVRNVMPRCGRDVNELGCLDLARRLPFDERLTFAREDDQRFFVAAGGMPADRFTRFEPNEAASHAGSLGRSFEERAVSGGALKRDSQRLTRRSLGNKRDGQQEE